MTLFANVLAWSFAATAVSAVTCTFMDTCAKYIFPGDKFVDFHYAGVSLCSVLACLWFVP